MAPGGYLWWYVDALSDDGRHGLTAIVFVGSVFSPYYAWARRRGGGVADPGNHVAVNLALYGEGAQRWTMTERGRGALAREALTLRIGPSALAWEAGELVLRFDERTAPWPRRLRGTLRLQPTALHDTTYALDGAGRHRWWPVAPLARARLELDAPRLAWQGHAYFDANQGDEPLERAFVGWDWQRATLDDGSCVVLYDARRRDGGETALALHFGADGADAAPRRLDAMPALRALPRTRWGLARGTRSAEPQAPDCRTLEDTPFYARSLLRTRLLGQEASAVHESLSLTRFASPLVQAMLPFRMPRRG